MNERQMHRADFITGLLLLAFGVTMTIMSVQMPRLENKDINPYTVPGIVPGFLGVIISLMSVVLVIRAAINRGFELGVTTDSVRKWITGGTARRLFVTLILTLFYALFLIGHIPYTAATFLFILVFILLFEWRRDFDSRRKIRVVTIAVVQALLTSLVVAGVFQYLFLVDLP